LINEDIVYSVLIVVTVVALLAAIGFCLLEEGMYYGKLLHMIDLGR